MRNSGLVRQSSASHRQASDVTILHRLWAFLPNLITAPPVVGCYTESLPDLPIARSSGRKNCGSELSATPIFSDVRTGPDPARRRMKESASQTPVQLAGGTGARPVSSWSNDTLFRNWLRRSCHQELCRAGFSDAESLLAAEDVVSSADAIVLDWQLPGLSGVELFAELQRRGIDNPVIFLTAYPLVENERRALLAGAADFIDKTRGFDVLVRRLNLVVNAAPGMRAQRRLERRGRLLLNPVEGRAFWDDVDVALTLGEYRVVELLARRSPAPATYREIHEQIRHQAAAAATADECRLNARSAVRRIRLKFVACDRPSTRSRTTRPWDTSGRPQRRTTESIDGIGPSLQSGAAVACRTRTSVLNPMSPVARSPCDSWKRLTAALVSGPLTPSSGPGSNFRARSLACNS